MRPDPTAKWLTDLSECTAQLGDGSNCGKPSAENAPFPICDAHAVQVYRFVTKRLGDLSDDPLFRLRFGIDAVDEERSKHRARMVDREEHVYYVQLGPHIKIGYTSRLQQRMKSYPLNRRLLAVEKGGYVLEQQRHQQFRGLLDVGNEWFKPGPELIGHINGLRVEAGSPAINKFL